MRTTAEQAEAKRKEREKKLKIYSETTNRIHEKVVSLYCWSGTLIWGCIIVWVYCSWLGVCDCPFTGYLGTLPWFISSAVHFPFFVVSSMGICINQQQDKNKTKFNNYFLSTCFGNLTQMSSELRSLQLWTQFKQLRIEAWKSQDFNGVWKLTWFQIGSSTYETFHTSLNTDVLLNYQAYFLFFFL